MRIILVLGLVLAGGCDNALPQRPLRFAAYQQPCITGFEGTFNGLCLVASDAETGVAMSFPYVIEGFTPMWGQTTVVDFVGYERENRPSGTPKIRYEATDVTVESTEPVGTPFTLRFPWGEYDGWFATLTATTVRMIDNSTTVDCDPTVCADLVSVGMHSATIAFAYPATGDPIVATSVIQVDP